MAAANVRSNMDSKNPTRRFAAGLLVTLALGAAAAGCGGEDQDFIDGYNAAVEPLQSTLANLNVGSQGAEAQKALEDTATKLEDVRTDIADLDAPDDAQDEVDRLVTAIDKGVEDMRAMASAAGDENLQKLQKAATDLQSSATEISSAEQALGTAVEG